VWPSDAEHLILEQRRLAALAPEPWRYTKAARVGACFVCFAEDGSAEAGGEEPAWSAAVTFDAGRRSAAAVVEGSTRAPYRSGLLALRAGPLLEHAVRRLPVRPDVLLVNATGRDHPRRAGLALHLGAVLGLPTVGVTDRLLTAGAMEPEPAADDLPARGLRLEGGPIGYLVRVREGARALVAHAAWRTDAETALVVLLAAGGRARTPLPLREARRLARTARAAARLAAPYPPGDPRPEPPEPLC
jgi:deoxyribonuclease V